VYVFGGLHVLSDDGYPSLDQILQLAPTPMTSVVDDGLDLVFFLVFIRSEVDV